MSLVDTAESAAVSYVSKAGHVMGVCFTLLLLGLGVGFMGGWSVHGWYDAKTTAAGEAKAIKSTAKETARRATVGESYSQRKQQIENFYAQDPDWWLRWSTAVPALGACDIGADGLRDWNLWNQGPAAYDPSKPVGALPRSTASGKQPAAGFGEKPQGGDAAVPRVQGQQGGADRGDKK